MERPWSLARDSSRWAPVLCMISRQIFACSPSPNWFMSLYFLSSRGTWNTCAGAGGRGGGEGRERTESQGPTRSSRVCALARSPPPAAADASEQPAQRGAGRPRAGTDRGEAANYDPTRRICKGAPGDSEGREGTDSAVGERRRDRGWPGGEGGQRGKAFTERQPGEPLEQGEAQVPQPARREVRRQGRASGGHPGESQFRLRCPQEGRGPRRQPR